MKPIRQVTLAKIRRIMFDKYEVGNTLNLGRGIVDNIIGYLKDEGLVHDSHLIYTNYPSNQNIRLNLLTKVLERRRSRKA
jgi:hypothetical protein